MADADSERPPRPRRNYVRAGVDPFSVDEVFISHYHLDHTGGLPDFLKINNKVKIYAPPSFKKTPEAAEIVYLNRPVKLHDNIFSTGELDNIEQSLAVKTEKGLVLIVVLWIGAREVLGGGMTGGQLGQFVLYAMFVAMSAASK